MIEERNRTNPGKDAAEKVARQLAFSEKQRRKRRDRAAAMGKLPEQTDDDADETDTKYGPNELALFPDKKIREDFRKYAWRWDRFVGSWPK